MRVDVTPAGDGLRFKYSTQVVVHTVNAEELHGFVFNDYHTFRLELERGYMQFSRSGFR